MKPFDWIPFYLRVIGPFQRVVNAVRLAMLRRSRAGATMTRTETVVYEAAVKALDALDLPLVWAMDARFEAQNEAVDRVQRALERLSDEVRRKGS